MVISAILFLGFVYLLVRVIKIAWNVAAVPAGLPLAPDTNSEVRQSPRVEPVAQQGPKQFVQAHDDEFARATLKGLNALRVLVEGLSDGVKVLGLTKEAIQADAELKLRLPGMGVVTVEKGLQLRGRPYLYVVVNTANGAKASKRQDSLSFAGFAISSNDETGSSISETIE